jgi:hypothetical protein
MANDADVCGRADALEGVDRVSGERCALHRLDALWVFAEPRSPAGRKHYKHRIFAGECAWLSAPLRVQHLVWAQLDDVAEARGLGHVLS